MYYKKIVFYIAVLIIIVPLTSCIKLSSSSNPTPSSSPKANTSKIDEEDKEDSPTIHIAVWNSERPVIKALIDSFKQSYPSFDIKIKEYPSTGYINKLADLVNKNEPIDLIVTKNVYEYAEFATKGYSQPIDEFFKKDGLTAANYKDLLNGLYYQEKLYGLPYRTYPQVLFYNKTLFDEVKIPYPNSRMTWGEYKQLAKKMSRMRKGSKLYGAYIDTNPRSVILPLVQKKFSIIDDNLSVIRSMIDYRIGMEKEGIIPTFYNQEKFKTHYNTQFQRGKMAMHVTGSWHIDQLIRAKEEKRIAFDWDITHVPFPDGSDPYITSGNASTIIMNSKSKNKEHAWTLLKYMGYSEGARVLAREKILPAFMSVPVKDILIGEKEPVPKSLYILTEQNIRIETPVDPYIETFMDQVVEPELSEALLGNISSDKCIENIVTKKQTILAKN